MNELYLYDGTFEGFLSAVFDAYARGNASPAIQPEEHGQMMLGASLYHVESNEKKSGRVMKKLYSLLGRNGFYRLCRAFLSEEEDREEALFGYIRLVISHGRAAENFLFEPCVIRTMEMARKTSREAEHLLGFLRFRTLESGTLYAEFSSKTDCLGVLAGHFRRRLSSLDFIINDVKRKKAAFYHKGQLDFFPYDGFDVPKDGKDEKEMRDMWKRFYRIAAIRERANERCRMNHMPKRFWAYMCEMEGEKSCDSQ